MLLVATVSWAASASSWSVQPPYSMQSPNEVGSSMCLLSDRSGCGIIVSKGYDGDAYTLTIDTGEYGVNAVMVRLSGRSIMLGRSELRRSENRGDRGSYSFYSRSSRSTRRISLPLDADITRADKSVSGNVITITVPRLEMPGPPQPFGYYPR